MWTELMSFDKIGVKKEAKTSIKSIQWIIID